MKHGIPTLFRGVQYRSRLEARWAATFDLLGWSHQYEPFDLAGWIPDFLLGSWLVVEVKPVTSFPAALATEIDQALPAVRKDDGRWAIGHEPLILGCVIPTATYGIGADEGRPIGWMRGTPGSWRPDLMPTWGRAIVQVFGEEDQGEAIGLYHEFDHTLRADPGFSPNISERHRFAWNRMGFIGEPIPWEIYTPEVEELPGRNTDTLRDYWNQAGNLVQWRGARSEAR